MKTVYVNGFSTCICEACDEPFQVAEQYMIHTTTLNIKNFITYEGVIMPYPEEDTTDLATHQKFFHTKCLKPPPETIDSIKQALNNLSPQQRKDVYKYLYHALGCRL